MLSHTPKFVVRVAEGPEDLLQAQRLRYRVFITEMGGTGAGIDHITQTEADHFDAYATHLLLEDIAADAPGRLVGIYRLMTRDMAVAAGGFYSAAEFDLAPLLATNHRLLELGRACLHPDYRGGPAMLKLWAGLAQYVSDARIDMLFGVASFQGTDVASLAQSLGYLHHFHSAPAALAPIARHKSAVALNALPKDQIDRKSAVVQIPTLIKAYLRMGGMVGQGAYVDHAFQTTDVCLLVNTHDLGES